MIYFSTSFFVWALNSAAFAQPVAGPAEYLRCYNELHVPAAPVRLFGVPITEELPPALSRLATNNKFREPLTNRAYIVTEKTILSRDFTRDIHADLGTRTSRRSAKLVHIAGTPVFEVDSRYSGVSGRTFLRATWESDIDHPNGAHLVIDEVASVKGKVEKLPSHVSLTPEAQAKVVSFLKDEIGEAVIFKKAPARAYQACHAIPELKEYLETKMNSFEKDASPGSGVGPKSGGAPVTR